MTKLTHAQRDLLTQAAGAETGHIEVTDTACLIMLALIKRGLMISVPQSEGPSRLLITEAGRAAIGDNAAPTAATPPHKRTPKVQPPPAASPSPKGKIPILLGMLQQPSGATIATMMEATGWQAHSVRGAMAGAIKKKLGFAVTSEKTKNGRIYRIVDGAGT